jgi:hypothetical protein
LVRSGQSPGPFFGRAGWVLRDFSVDALRRF